MVMIPEEDIEIFIEKLKSKPCEPPLAVWNRYACDIKEGGERETS